MRYKMALSVLSIIFAMAALHLFMPTQREFLLTSYVYEPYKLHGNDTVGPLPTTMHHDSGDLEPLLLHFTFSSEDTAANDALAADIILLIDMLAELIPQSDQTVSINTINIVSWQELLMTLRPGMLDSAVSLAYDSQNSMGWLTHAKSGRRFPMWLSVGVEAVAMRYLDTYMPTDIDVSTWDSFGDSYFTPLSLGRADDVICVAYYFTRFLMDEGVFLCLADYFLQEDWAAANALAGASFYQFTGHNGLTSYRMVISPMHGYAYSVAIDTDIARYRFMFDSFNQEVESAMILSNIDYMDDSIEFTIDWYLQWVDFEYYPMDVYIYYRRSVQGWYASATYPRQMSLYDITNNLPTSAPHEASHLLTTWVIDDVGMVFTPFDEGLAFAMMAYHGYHDRYNHGLEYQFRRGQLGRLTSALRGAGIRNASAVAQRLVEDFDIIGIFHVYAYVELAGHVEGIALDPWSRMDFESEYLPGMDMLNTFGKSASFVLYLIENYGAEAYMKVHFDLGRFEEVYEATLYEMTGSWFEYIQIFMNGL